MILFLKIKEVSLIFFLVNINLIDIKFRVSIYMLKYIKQIQKIDQMCNFSSYLRRTRLVSSVYIMIVDLLYFYN